MSTWDEDKVDESDDEYFEIPYDDDEHIDWDNNEEAEGAD
jgi:hypothetical protein